MSQYIKTLRRQVRQLWAQGKSLAQIEAQIEAQLQCSIEIGGSLSDLPCHIHFGNFGIYPK